MVRAIGIDPGTLSFDICGLEDGRLFWDETFLSHKISAAPERLVDCLKSVGPVDLIVGPSGYGLPWVRADRMTKIQRRLMVLSEQRDLGRKAVIGGMNRMVRLLKQSGLPILFAPGLIHLPTIPAHRKVNKIDMGTADKLCALALGIWDQARHLNINFKQTSFIYLELGGAFTGVMTVDKGRVVDGSGGTSGCLGYQAMGAMDGELAYLLGSFNKSLLCSGGMAHIAGKPDMEPNAFDPCGDKKMAMAWEAFMEGLVKCVAAQAVVLPDPREILISGRLGRMARVVEDLKKRLSTYGPVRRIKGFAKVAKEGAQGAAILADGLARGTHRDLVETMGLDKAKGTVLDHLYFEGAKAFTKKYLEIKE